MNWLLDCCVQEYRGQQLKQLVHALCPAIYGHELVKAGVVLALFGGVRKGNDDLASVPVRGDIHCLIVGDPGIGKSQLLKVWVCPRLSPSAVFCAHVDAGWCTFPLLHLVTQVLPLKYMPCLSLCCILLPASQLSTLC